MGQIGGAAFGSAVPLGGTPSDAVVRMPQAVIGQAIEGLNRTVSLNVKPEKLELRAGGRVLLTTEGERDRPGEFAAAR